MDDDFDDPEVFAALKAAEASHSRQTGVQSGQSVDRPQNGAGNAANSSAPKVQQPTPQALPKRGLASAVLVSTRQKGNPALNYITSMPWEYTDTPADYVLGQTTCALFLSLKYHRLHPEYIYGRIRALAGKFNLRVLLALVDIDNHEEPLRELAKTSLVNNLTLILCWSSREVARYLEAYKSLERADPSGIKGAKAASFAEHMQEFITTPRGVNKTDAISLVSSFGNIRNAVNADREQIVAIPGWGEKKVGRFVATVNEPFRIGRTTKKVGRDRDGTGNEIRRIGMLTKNELSSLAGSNTTPAPEVPSASVRKRGRDEIGGNDMGAAISAWEPGEDEEEALFVAERQPNPIAVPAAKGTYAPEQTDPLQRRKPDEPALSEGIEAALAKLRN